MEASYGQVVRKWGSRAVVTALPLPAPWLGAVRCEGDCFGGV